MKLEHIGIAVENLEESEKIFETLLQTKVYKREEVPEQSVRTSFLCREEVKIELLSDTTENGPIARFLQKRGPGIHHLAFEVNNIYDEIHRLQKEGYTLIDEIPRRGADNKLIAFLHPASTGKVLIELCQSMDSGTSRKRTPSG